jgi:hypothetical protein
MCSGARAVVQARAVHGQLLEQPPLRIERLHLVVQQQATGGLVRGRRARQHHQGHPFGIGTGDHVDEVEGTGAVGHRRHPEAATGTRRAVGRETHAGLVRQGHQRQQCTVFDLAKQRQRKVARDAEDLGGPPCLQGLQQAFGQVQVEIACRRRRHCGSVQPTGARAIGMAAACARACGKRQVLASRRRRGEYRQQLLQFRRMALRALQNRVRTHEQLEFTPATVTCVFVDGHV